MAETREFKTESKRLLELMVHSIYTNREIFLRELISNASDAIDKHRFLALTDEKLRRDEEYQILLEPDKKRRKLSVTDNGIGMTYEELIESLGTIAKSGSSEFLEGLKDKSDTEALEIIGQFGVGFIPPSWSLRRSKSEQNRLFPKRPISSVPGASIPMKLMR